MEIFGVDAWDEKKCVHASTLETGLMHGAERQELVHHLLEARAGGARAGAGPSARAGDARRQEARKATEDSGRRLQREGFWSMGLGVEPAGCQGCRTEIYSS